MLDTDRPADDRRTTLDERPIFEGESPIERGCGELTVQRDDDRRYVFRHDEDRIEERGFFGDPGRPRQRLDGRPGDHDLAAEVVAEAAFDPQAPCEAVQ